jgi:uncharacterized membrane protein/cell division protein FtsB
MEFAFLGWNLNPIFDSYLLCGLLVAGLAMLLVVRPTAELSGRRWLTLIALRLVAILFISIALLQPSIVQTVEKQQSAVVALMFDKSRSMTLPYLSQGQSRWEAQLSLLKDNEPLLNEVADKYELNVFAYDDKLIPLERTDGSWNWPAAANGGLTDIGSTLFDVAEQQRGKRVAAFILMGDGRQTAYNPQVEIQNAQRAVGERALHALPLGPPGDSMQSQDVMVENLPDSYRMFVKNELVIRGVIGTRGYVNKEIDVTLTVEDSEGNQEILPVKKVMPREDDAQMGVEFSYVPQSPGQYRLTLAAAKQPGELVTRNNELSAFLTVSGGGLKVLYLEGALRPEQKFLRRSLAESEDIELDFRWFSSRNRDAWPVTFDAPLAESDYDVIILGDLDSAALGEKNLKDIMQAVENGKGLIMTGGYHSFGPGGYQREFSGGVSFGNLLPVLMGDKEKQDFDRPIQRDLHLTGPLKVQPLEQHFLTELAAGSANLETWEALPPLTGANKFAGVSSRGRVLVETTDGDAILVIGNYGSGRVAAFAADSTWRWWMQGHKDAHLRFWRTMILWLGQRDQEQENDVWVSLQKRRVLPRSKLEFVAGANSATGASMDATFTAKWISAGGDSKSLSTTSTDVGRVEGDFSAPEKPGSYEVIVQARRGDKLIGEAKSRFMVEDQDVELSNPAPDFKQMEQLAAATTAAGGSVLAPEQFADLLRQLRDAPPLFRVEQQQRWQLFDDALSAWLFVIAFVSLLTAEWFLRKRWGMV